jgi:hypothetical protein
VHAEIAFLQGAANGGLGRAAVTVRISIVGDTNARCEAAPCISRFKTPTIWLGPRRVALRPMPGKLATKGYVTRSGKNYLASAIASMPR